MSPEMRVLRRLWGGSFLILSDFGGGIVSAAVIRKPATQSATAPWSPASNSCEIRREERGYFLSRYGTTLM